MSKPTADSDKSLRGIPRAVLEASHQGVQGAAVGVGSGLHALRGGGGLLGRCLGEALLVTSFELFLKLTKFFGRPTFLGDFCIFTGALAAFIFLARPSFFPASCTLLGEGLLELSIFLRGAADLTYVLVEGQRWNAVKCIILFTFLIMYLDLYQYSDSIFCVLDFCIFPF